MNTNTGKTCQVHISHLNWQNVTVHLTGLVGIPQLRVSGLIFYLIKN
jgi:hypothetical protein